MLDVAGKNRSENSNAEQVDEATPHLDDVQLPDDSAADTAPLFLRRLPAASPPPVPNHSQPGDDEAETAGDGAPPAIQPKLTVGPPDDEFEREADSVAERVQRMPAPSADEPPQDAGDEQTTPPAGSVQRKSVTPRYLQSSSASAAVGKLVRSASGGSPLDHAVKPKIERVVGQDLSHVRIHDDSAAHDAARSLGARAFTNRNHVWLGAGESPQDAGLLGHEATHVVQQQETGREAIQRLVTDEGDYLPDPIIVDWGERFEIRFGTRTTGYGDVLIQYKIRYLGSFAGDASDLNFVMEAYPGGVRKLGVPHSRRLNAELIAATSDSITLDIYGDGKVKHRLWHTLAWSVGEKKEMHQIELVQNGEFAGRRTLTSLRTEGTSLRTESGIVATVTPPTFKPDPDRAPQLPTGMLLDMVEGRINDLKALPFSRGTVALFLKIKKDQQTATQAGDDTGIARGARRLLDLLTYLGPVFATIDNLSKPDQYLGGLELDAIEEVNRIADLYVDAMIEAYDPRGSTESLALADKALHAFPDWLNFLYLRDPRGVKSITGQIPAMQDELRVWRRKNGNLFRAGTRKADEMVKFHMGARGGASLHGGFKRRRESIEWAWRDERDYVRESIRDLYADAQFSVALLTAMTVHQQILFIWRELNRSWINSGMEWTFWGERTDKARKYLRKLDEVVQLFTDTAYEKDGTKKQAAIKKALDQLSGLLGSKKFQNDVDDFQTRLKWVDRIDFVGKLAIIIAAAALTGGSAGSLAFTGLRAVGASAVVATGGELILGGLAFTIVARTGQKLAFGKLESSFLSDWFWNSATLGVLKAANYGFTRIFRLKLDPKVAKIRYHLGRSATAMIALHGVAEMHHLASKGQWMSGEERVNAVFQNVALMVALEAGRFITAPLEARLTSALIGKLKIDVKLAARIESIASERRSVKKQLESLSRGESSPAEVRKLLLEIEGLWAKELGLVNDAVGRKIINEGEMTTALAAYKQHIAGMQLRLSQLGIEAPAPDATIFRPIARGVVEFAPEGRAALEKYYKPDANDPSTAGKSLKESKSMPGVLEGRLPNGELTYYVPKGTVAKGIPNTQGIIAGRDAAVLAAKSDSLAAEGLRRLQAGLKGSGPKEKGLAQRRIDDILGALRPETVVEFLHAMADPAFTQRPGADFYTGLAGRPQAIEFARAYGPAVLLKIFSAYKWNDAGMLRAKGALEDAKSPAARKEFIDKLLKSSPRNVPKFLGEVKVKPPRHRPVSKKTLGVDRSSTEWLALRNDAAAAFAQKRSTPIKPEAVDLVADMLQIHLKARLGKFAKWKGNQSAIENLLDKFDQLADRAAKADPSPEWSAAVQGQRNSLIGAIGEAVGRPAGVAKHKGAFLAGQAVSSATSGATIPDYSQAVGGVTEWVNIKSDHLTRGAPGRRSGTFGDGVSRASEYRSKADLEAGNLPAGDKYSIQFLRDPLRANDAAAGRRTEKRMLETLFNEGSPIYRVKFGARPWISRDAYKGGGK